jgi:hypothetical protein
MFIVATLEIDMSTLTSSQPLGLCSHSFAFSNEKTRTRRVENDKFANQFLSLSLNMKINYFKRVSSLLLSSIALFFSTACFSQNVITLICKTDDGITMHKPLIIDYSKNSANWGGPDLYEIKYKTEEWLTLVQGDAYNKIGGEIALINRLTGEYKRVRIGEFCTDSTCKSKKINNAYYFGTCYQQKY